MNKREYAKLKKWTDTLTDEELKICQLVAQRLSMRRDIGKWQKENE